LPKLRLFAVLALSLTGCASPLASTVGVVNALSAGSVAAGTKLNADFAAAEKACLITPTLPAQRACLDRTEAAMMPALVAFDDFDALRLVVVALVRTEEAREALGGKPSLAQLAMLVPQLMALAQRFNEALVTLRRPAKVTP
jgi:hypothetical protein